MAVQKIVVEGVRNPDKLPQLASIEGADLRFAKGPEQLRTALPGAEVMLGFGYRDRALAQTWDQADSLAWIQWCAAGVDSLLFPELVDSRTVVTNAAGIFDRDIAEWVVGIAIAISKDFRRSWRAQDAATWKFFPGERLAGTTAAVIGAGGIGRAIARRLSAMGVTITLFASTTRRDDEYGTIHAWRSDHEAVATADWVITALPNVPGARGLINRTTFDAMNPHSVFINVGRGDSVVEADLQDALAGESIAAAALDVVQDEPLDQTSPWWSIPNVIITPHNSGDVRDSTDRIVDLFLDNLERYRSGAELRNVVDKERGY